MKVDRKVWRRDQAEGAAHHMQKGYTAYCDKYPEVELPDVDAFFEGHDEEHRPEIGCDADISLARRDVGKVAGKVPRAWLDGWCAARYLHYERLP